MELSEIVAARYTGAKLTNFKLNNGEELDYQLAIEMIKREKSKI
jgi:hypothetical protein